MFKSKIKPTLVLASICLVTALLLSPEGGYVTAKSRVPVEEEINLEGLAEENERLRYQIGCHPENVRSTLLNGRKMSLSALLEIEAKITKYTKAINSLVTPK